MGQDKIGKKNEEHGKYCFKEKFQLPRVKFDRDCVCEREGETDREALGLINCSIHNLDESELELA